MFDEQLKKRLEGIQNISIFFGDDPSTTSEQVAEQILKVLDDLEKGDFDLVPDEDFDANDLGNQIVTDYSIAMERSFTGDRANLFPLPRRIEYVLPRQTGATTFLIRYLIKMLSEGRDAIMLVHSRSMRSAIIDMVNHMDFDDTQRPFVDQARDRIIYWRSTKTNHLKIVSEYVLVDNVPGFDYAAIHGDSNVLRITTTD